MIIVVVLGFIGDKKMSERKKIQLPKIPSWIKLVVFVILICGSNIAYTEIRINIEKEESYARLYFLECRVRVSYDNGSPIFIDLIRSDDIIEYNQLTEGDRIEFQLINSQLGIIANFSKVEIYFYIEQQLWMKYDLIQANFFIEDKLGVIRKYDFDKSIDGMPIYIGIRDITNLMWKDAVPQEIRANVIFNNI